jgi:hypothetical protein
MVTLTSVSQDIIKRKDENRANQEYTQHLRTLIYLPCSVRHGIQCLQLWYILKWGNLHTVRRTYTFLKIQESCCY